MTKVKLREYKAFMSLCSLQRTPLGLSFLILKTSRTKILLTFNCDLETFPHFSTSNDVKAYQMDFRSSDFRSIFWRPPGTRKTTFPKRCAAAFYAATGERPCGENSQAKQNVEQSTHCGANDKGPNFQMWCRLKEAESRNKTWSTTRSSSFLIIQQNDLK